MSIDTWPTLDRISVDMSTNMSADSVGRYLKFGNYMGRRVSKAKYFEAKYEPKMEFPEGWVVSNQNSLSGRGMDILWINTLLELLTWI